MKTLLIIWCGLSTLSIFGQELPKNLIYANDNLVFEDVIRVGDNLLLRVSPQNKQNQRFIYLLDEKNLVVDTMRVLGNDRFLIRSDSTFSIRGLSEYVNVTIQNNRFNVTLSLENYSDFSNEILNPIFFVGNYLVGSLYSPVDDCIHYKKYLSDSLKFLVSVPKLLPETYNFNDLDTLYLLSLKHSDGFSGNELMYSDKYINELIPALQTCVKRISSPYFGWNSYSVHKNSFFMYEKSNGSLYEFDIAGDLALKSKFDLPVKDKNDGWKYFFDETDKKHFFSKRITEETEPSKKRKKRNTEKSYTYEFYSFEPKTSTLKALVKMGFEPKMIDNGLIYEVVSESKKGSALYFHPIDPNYVYQKSRLVYSEGN